MRHKGTMVEGMQVLTSRFLTDFETLLLRYQTDCLSLFHSVGEAIENPAYQWPSWDDLNKEKGKFDSLQCDKITFEQDTV